MTRTNKTLVTGLYVAGLAFLVTFFLVFVPADARTNKAWLNFMIFLFLYSGLWGKFSFLFVTLEKISVNVPTLAMYWMTYGAYAVASLITMALLALFKVGFGKQCLFQAFLFFLFILCIGIGAGASNFLKAESARIDEQNGGMKDIQFKAEQLRVLFASLPAGNSFVKSELGKVIDEINYIGGCNNPKARTIETQILRQLGQLEECLTLQASPDKCLEAVKSLAVAVALRKAITNV